MNATVTRIPNTLRRFWLPFILVPALVFSFLRLAHADDPQTTFEQNAFVYPNPIRNGQATFKFQSARDGATIRLRIYALDGTLVLDQSFGGLTTGTPVSYAWNATNQSGKKLGRGLYYYVLRESDPEGVLEVTKKLAVIQ